MAESIVQNLIEFIPRVRGNGFSQLNSGISRVHNNLFSLKNMFGAFFGYDLYSSIRNAIPALIGTSRQLGAIHARLYAATGTAKGANEEMTWLLDTTKKLGLELMSTSDQYSLFAASAKQTFNKGEIRELFGDMLKLQRVLHIPAESMKRVEWAFTKMSSEGTVKMRDFLQLQQIPGAIPLAMKSLGFKNNQKGMEKFFESIRKREVSSKKFMPLFLKELMKQYVTEDKLATSMNQVDAQLQLLQRHAQGFQVELIKAGFNKDLISSLKFINKGLAFAEKHAHGIYTTLKLIGFSLIAIGGFMTVINLPGTILALGEAVELLVNIRKNLLMIQLMSAGMAGAAGVEAGATAGILLFLTQPALWIPLAIIALGAVLGWVIKKFFPNVWKTFMAYWVLIENKAYELMDALMKSEFMQTLIKFYGAQKTGFAKEIQNKQTAMRQRYPNHPYQFAFNVAGALQAYSDRLSPSRMGYSFGRKLGDRAIQSITTHFNPNTKIDIHIDGSKDPESIGQKIADFFDDFKEKQNNEFKKQIVNSRITNKNPFGLLSLD